MPILKTRKMHEMGDKELEDKLKEVKLELSKERGLSEIGTVKNPGRIRELRKATARILTEKSIRKRRLEIRGKKVP